MSAQDIIGYFSWIDGIAGGVWMILTGLMIGMLIRTYRQFGRMHKYFYLGLGLLIFVWMYPLYTSFYTNIIIGEIGNVATLIFTLVVMMALK